MSKGIQIIDPEERFTINLEGAAFVVRRLDSATAMALERRHRGGADKQAVADDALDYIIQDWQGVTSSLGDAPAPCTRENKLRLPTAIKLRLMAAAQLNRAEDNSAD
ncbi:hypothetical protein Deba_0144 [Desulfarculus baarsii DSM 2075]|uniref:Uncharacterized protein n=1 Tax=Desulfarculus baarsii (strain ATCC 33931 / DSM 2075 / LMG 7858 / VKM B-1802 / 2st14) TaxID=644282 RepID=E1QDK4_DESB2|nr:hypothetical protein [Desulfarculus baarsii]ADK83523.1 hypothetical protein Deba_0144 [Desulfarculus baarsii DSM 2075]